MKSVGMQARPEALTVISARIIQHHDVNQNALKTRISIEQIVVFLHVHG